MRSTCAERSPPSPAWSSTTVSAITAAVPRLRRRTANIVSRPRSLTGRFVGLPRRPVGAAGSTRRRSRSTPRRRTTGRHRKGVALRRVWARHRDRDDPTTPVRVLCLNPAVDDLQPDCILGGVEVEPTHLWHTVDRRPEPTAFDAREQAPGDGHPTIDGFDLLLTLTRRHVARIQPRLTRTIRPSSSSSGATNQSPARCRRCGSRPTVPARRGTDRWR